MLKKTITYTDYNDNEVTEDFYFNFTKLELLEKDMEFDGLEELVERLTETEDHKQAYGLFKTFLLAAYGKKSPDGRKFIKEENGRPLSEDLESSPALSELIIEFLNNPELGAQFIEACLPTKLVQEVKEAQTVSPKDVQLPTAAPVLSDEQVPVAPEKKNITEFTRDELLSMPNEQFNELAGTDPTKMDRSVLEVAMQRRNRGL